MQKDQKRNNDWIEITDLKAVGGIIRHKRKRMGLTQSDVAGLCNVGTRFISELENGKPTMQFDKALKVLYSLGFTFGVRRR